MKKAILLLSIVLCTSALFASNNTISINFSPVSLQIATASESEHDTIITSGISTEVAYKRIITGGLFAEGGIAFGAFAIPDDRPTLTSLMAFAGIGYQWYMTDIIKLSTNVDVGVDTLFYDGSCSETIAIMTGIGLGFDLSDRLDVTIGCDCTFGFSRKNDIDYVNYRIVPTVGICINF